MRNKRLIITIIVMVFSIITNFGLGGDENCPPSPPPPGPGGDNPDENYSFAVSVLNPIANFSSNSELYVLDSGYYKEALTLLSPSTRRMSVFKDENNYGNLLSPKSILIIPSVGLFEKENDSILKNILVEFVKGGGTLIVFAQQYGSHIDNVVPVPEGESLKTFGFREDSSCLRNSSYFENIHPILSSSTNELLDAGVDGYFSVYPSNSTILLKRKINLEPALLYYPYGNGTVILTSMFTDWGYTHSQATTSEIKIIRDLITFAKNPHLPIPMYNLEENPTPGIDLNVSIINNTAEPSTKAKMVVYTPDRKTVLYETEASVSLNAGESATIPVNYTLPELQTWNYGVCHVDYELYNAENEIIQLPTESDIGRFSIYKIITPITIKDGLYMWVTVKDENVYWGQDVEFTIHFKNTRSESRTLDINNPFFCIGHGGSDGPTFPSFQVVLPPGGEYSHVALMPTTLFNSNVKSAITVRIQYYDTNGVLKQTGPGKVIFLKVFGC